MAAFLVIAAQVNMPDSAAVSMSAPNPCAVWVACRPGFFLPVRVLARLFRRLFLRDLQNAYDAGRLRFSGPLAGLADAAAFNARVAELRRVDWVIYAKPPFGGPRQALAYLGRHTHRVAIANMRRIAVVPRAPRQTHPFFCDTS